MLGLSSPRLLSFPVRRFLARGQAVVSVFALVTFASAGLALAADWPQILGPNRDGSTTTRDLATTWAASTAPSWSQSVGSGYAGAAIVGNTVYLPHRVSDREHLSAFNLETGEELWQANWPASYEGGYNADDGPRCVPSVSKDGKVICYDAAGSLRCIDGKSGNILWGRELRAEYRADDGFFGAGSTPIIVGDKVIACIGGKNAGIVAVDLENGTTRWTATDYDASYSAPIDVSQGEKSRVLVVTRVNTVLVNAENGDILDDLRFGSRGTTVNAATPIAIAPNRYFLTASYGIGALALTISNDELKEDWRETRLINSQYNTPVMAAGSLIGVDGREDVGSASLKAVDARSKRVLWEQPRYETAHLISLGNQVLSVALEGRMDLIDGTANRYLNLATTQLPAGKYRALPALSDKRLVVRATTGASSSQLMMFELP